MDLVVVLGKLRKNITAYILLPPDCPLSIDVLSEKRTVVNIPVTNKYVFARGSADSPISGTTDMREVAQMCPLLEFPSRITSTYLRKYIATVSQVRCEIIS